MRKRKGQWLVIGSLVLIIAMAGLVMAKTSGIIDSSKEKQSFDNIKTEIGYAGAAMAYSSTDSTELQNRMDAFYKFLNTYSTSHTVDLNGFMMVGLPSGSGMNVTVLNMFVYDMLPFNITMLYENGTQISSAQMNIDSGATTKFTFPSLPQYFIVHYSFTANSTAYSDTFNMNRRAFTAYQIQHSTSTARWTATESR